MQGRLKAESGDRKTADTLFRKVIGRPDAGGELVYGAFYALSDVLEKIRLLPRVAGKLDGRPGHLLLMGSLFHNFAWNYDLARRYYSTGLDQDPYQFQTYVDLARVYGSHEPLQVALEKFPDNLELLELAARYFSEKGDESSRVKAAEFLSAARKISPSHVSIVQSHARVLVELERYQDALEVIGEWIDRYGGNDLNTTILIAQRADVHLRMDRPEEALASLGTAVESFQAGAMLATARAYEKMGDVPRATVQYQRVVDRYSTVGHVLSAAAAFFWRQGEDDFAARMIARGRGMQGPHSRWYFDDFLAIYKETPSRRVYGAVQALQKHGATPWELKALTWSLADVGRIDVAFGTVESLRGSGMMQSLENVATAYRLLVRWKGQRAASEYLRRKVPASSKGPFMSVLYKRGMFDTLLREMGHPHDYSTTDEEFVWLQQLIVWLALDRKPAELGERLFAHYRTESTLFQNVKGRVSSLFQKQSVKTRTDSAEGYFFIGRFLLGLIPRDDLLKVIQSRKQRCEFAYYIGLAERLRGNFDEATQWYHLCRETLLQNNGEFHWASNEMFWWAHMGLEKRHRLLKDDIEFYNMPVHVKLDQPESSNLMSAI
jgi:tetratricopeptide (TPR) repeat protein